jgi:bifunctional DNA-binding transcriptional regulator/antitoxin component of YhaV-PrlF toxin-antitoxin module
MTTIQVHYDGWLSLPPDARESLGVSTGDRLEAEFVDGALVLRPARPPKAAIKAEPEVVEEDVPATAAPAPIQAKRGPGRPRKLAAAGLLPNIKVGGRRRAPTAQPTQS